MKSITKEIVLTSLIFLEVCFACVFLLTINNNLFNKQQSRIQGAAIIDDRLLTKTPFQNLTYYYKPSPNEVIEDHPSWLDEKIIYTINSDGLNERFEYEVTKSADIFRIIAIGDSHTFGHYVNTKQNYPERLEDTLRWLNTEGLFCKSKKTIEVINLGMMGYDVEYTIQRYLEDGIKYNPDLILWFIKYDDIIQILEKIIPRIKEIEYIQSINSPHLQGDPEHAYDAFQKTTWEYEKSVGKDKIFYYNGVLIEDFIQNLTTNMIFITYKNDEMTNTFLRSCTESYPNTKILSLFKEKEIDRLPDSHPSNIGYAYIANTLSTYLTKNQEWFCVQ